MGIGRKASAISGGALALALGGGLPVLAASPAQAYDCAAGGGLLSTVTGTACALVNGVTGTLDRVTDAVDGVTGGATAPLSKILDKTGTALSGTTEALNNTVKNVEETVKSAGDSVGATVRKTGEAAGGAVQEAGEAAGGALEETAGAAVDEVGQTVNDLTLRATSSPAAQRLTEGLGGAVRESCPPLALGSCADPDAVRRPGMVDGEPPRRVASSPAPGTLPVEPHRPRQNAERERTGEASAKNGGRRVHPDTDGLLPLLWPDREAPTVNGKVRGEEISRDRRQDPAGTVVTAGLLLSALLATRIVSARRARAGDHEQRAVIPLEGGLWRHERTGRHRLA